MERKTPSKLDIPILLVAMVFPSILTYVYFVYLADSATGMQKVAYGLGKTIQFALPVAWVALVCRESWRIRRFNHRGLAEGIGFGLLVFGAMIGLYLVFLAAPGAPLGEGSFARTTIYNRIASFELTDGRVYILLGLFYSLIHSGLEEYYWRWFVFGRMSRILYSSRLKFPARARERINESADLTEAQPIAATGCGMLWLPAAVISSLGFMAHHVIILGTYFGYGSFYCWLGSLGVAVGGFYWSWLYRRSDSIWGPWISHGVIDAAIFTIGFMIVTGH